MCRTTCLFFSYIIGATLSCSISPFDGIYITKLQATSDEFLLAAEVSKFDSDFEAKTKKMATISLNEGSVTEGNPPPGITVYPSGLGEPFPQSDYNFTYVQNPTDGVVTATISNNQTNDTVSFPLPDVAIIGDSLTGETRVDAVWFVSTKVNRSYLFYDKAPVDVVSQGLPQTVAVIAPAPGQDGDVTYLTDHDIDKLCTPCNEHVRVYESIQLAEFPSVSTCERSNIVFYNETVVEQRNLDRAVTPPKGLAAAPEETGPFVYEPDYATDGVQGFAIVKHIVPIGDTELFELNSTGVVGLFGSAASWFTPLNRVCWLAVPAIFAILLVVI